MQELIWSGLIEPVAGMTVPEYGIYRMHLADSDGRLIPICRLAGSDPEGVLYIGRSGKSTAKTPRHLSVRIGEFVRWGPHSGANTYQQAAKVLARRGVAVGHRVFVSTCALCDADVTAGEKRALRAYFESFAELPPFNTSFSGKHDA